MTGRGGAGGPAPGWLAEDLAIAREQIAADPYTPGAPGHTAAVARASAASAASDPLAAIAAWRDEWTRNRITANYPTDFGIIALHDILRDLFAADAARRERDARVQEAARATEKTAKERHAYWKDAALPSEASAWSSIAALASVLGRVEE